MMCSDAAANQGFLMRFALLLLATGFFMSALLPGPALAISSEAAKKNTADAAPELDEAALRAAVAVRIRATRGLQEERFKKFSQEQVRIDKTIPLHFDDMTFFAVKASLVPMPAGTPAESLLMVVDKSGTLHIDDIQDLASGTSLVQAALQRLVQIDDIPADFGKEIFKSSGPHDVIAVSDPFCPHCRKGWDYFTSHRDKIRTFRLAHFPLDRSSAIVCMVLADAGKRSFDMFEIVEFAYTHLQKAQTVEGILDQFISFFPELAQKWGDDTSQAVAYLDEKYSERIQADRDRILELGIHSIPVYAVNGRIFKGFETGELDGALP